MRDLSGSAEDLPLSMISLLLLTAPWTWHAEAGGQLDSDPHGVANVGFATDDLALEILTDTVELWLRAGGDESRAYVGLRLQGFASQLLISPWTRGARDPSRALISPHIGIAAGFIDYLGAGFYAGMRASARGFVFFARSAETTIEPPDPVLVITPEAVLGWWSEEASVELAGGADVREDLVSGRVELRASWKPTWIVAPRVELFAGAGHQLDDLTKTRIGGLNPYVIPLAGAAWAEWWVEDYATVRAGPQVSWSWGSLALVADAAVFDDDTRGDRFIDPWAVGFALLSRARFGTFFVDAAFGVAPWIERQQGVLRVSGWLLVGTDARPF